MAKLKNVHTSGEQGHGSRGSEPQGKGPVGGRPNDESSQEIHGKSFGHVKTTTRALHGKDPYKASHKL